MVRASLRRTAATRPVTRHPGTRRLVAGGLLAGCLIASAGCGTPPELRDPPGSVLPPPSTATPSTTPTRPPVNTPRPTLASPAFGESVAVPCSGDPSSEQVLALLRRTPNLLPRNAQVTVVSPGPRCAGTWQYTVVQVAGQDPATGRDPLQVVTKGTATSLTLVTAGTDVCSIPVRTAAPAGIRSIACDAVPGGIGG